MPAFPRMSRAAAQTQLCRVNYTECTKLLTSPPSVSHFSKKPLLGKVEAKLLKMPAILRASQQGENPFVLAQTHTIFIFYVAPGV